MAHKIGKHDLGFLMGDSTWHGLPQYQLTGARPVTSEEVRKVVGFPIEVVPTYVRSLPAWAASEQLVESGYNAVVRPTSDGTVVLAPAVSRYYKATPHARIYDSMTEFLLADMPLDVCGTGTLENGRTWWIQMKAAEYAVRGDPSPNELRLCYYQTFGKTSHRMFCSRVRIVCSNTLGFAEGSAIASKMFMRLRHAGHAEAKINANLTTLAELHMRLESETKKLNALTLRDATPADVRTFVEIFMPLPEEPCTPRSVSIANASRETMLAIYEGGQHMDKRIRRSRYALLTAFTDWVDHHSRTRNDTDRWMDSLDGQRAKLKEAALVHLLAV